MRWCCVVLDDALQARIAIMKTMPSSAPSSTASKAVSMQQKVLASAAALWQVDMDIFTSASAQRDMSTQQHIGGSAQACVSKYAKQHRRPGTSRQFGAREHQYIRVSMSARAHR
jgi:hypothetical protein